MPLVERQIAGVCGRIGFIDSAVFSQNLIPCRIGSASRGCKLPQQAVIILLLHRIMQHHHSNGSDFRLDARAVISLALVKHGAKGKYGFAFASGVLSGCAILRLHIPNRDGGKFLSEIDVDPMASSSAVMRRVFGPRAETYTGISSSILISFLSGLRNP